MYNEIEVLHMYASRGDIGGDEHALRSARGLVELVASSIPAELN